MQHLRLRSTITAASLLVAGGHLLWPHLRIDAITVALIVIALLPWVTVLLKSLELPGGFKVEFHVQPTDVQRKRLAEETKEAKEQAEAVSASPGARSASPATTESYLLAEELALRALNEDEFAGSVRRQIIVKSRSDLAFDGVGVRNGIEILIEVKLTRFPSIQDGVIADLLTRLRSVHQEFREHHSGGGMPLLLAVVADLSDSEVGALRESLEAKYASERSLEIRVFGFGDLKRRYGVDG